MRVALWIGASCVLGCLAAESRAATPAKKTAPPAKPALAKENLVELALRAEVRGDRAAREAFLEQALQAAPDDAAAHWHAGDVWHDETWLKPSEVAARLVDDRRLTVYRDTRDSYPDTVEGQLDLALWCAKIGLHDQKRAHLTRVLELNPNEIRARQELGFRWVDGVWLSAEEIANSTRRAEQAEQSLAVWSPKLLNLRDTMERRNLRQRELAVERLQEIKDPTAIPALEAVFGDYSEPASFALVDALDGIVGVDASVALARQAVFSPSEAVRLEASERLSRRRFVEFVPPVLNVMYSPMQSRSELFVSPSGRLTYQHAFYRESQDSHQVQVVRTDVVWRRPTVHHSYRQPFLHELLQAQQRLLRLAEQQRAAAEWQDARNVEVTQRACQALSLATGHALPERADAWWNWWDEHNEVSYATEKPTYERVDSNVVGSFLPELPGEYVRHSCLVAGTHVLTETGSVAVEEIEPGDRVLAQDPESGELAYKPVLRTTRRDPVETLTLDAGEAGSLSCTGGHQFWVSGKGWLRARQLEPGMMLHTVDGSAELQQASKGPTAEVFNLVVADFHSYFVADGKWLSHDITPQAPTNTIVPGLLAAR